MHRRCCWPPERPSADSCRRSLTSSQRAADMQAFLDRLVEDGAVAHRRACAGRRRRCQRCCAGNGLDFWKTMPTSRRSFTTSTDAVMDVNALDEDRALGDAGAGDFIVHAVEAAQQGGFAAAGGADEGGDLPFREVEADVLEGTGVTRSWKCRSRTSMAGRLWRRRCHGQSGECYWTNG